MVIKASARQNTEPKTGILGEANQLSDCTHILTSLNPDSLFHLSHVTIPDDPIIFLCSSVQMIVIRINTFMIIYRYFSISLIEQAITVLRFGIMSSMVFVWQLDPLAKLIIPLNWSEIFKSTTRVQRDFAKIHSPFNLI